MSAPDFSLLARRRFAPLFAVQFLGAFNDIALKYAMLFLASFTLYADAPAKAAMLATAATGIFILPYFLFSALGGELADGVDKARLIRWVKLAEIAFMTLGLIGLTLHSIPLLLVALFCMGCHSTIFGPVKYSLLPQHLQAGELLGGTALIEAGTFLAILTGQLLAGVVAPWWTGLICTALAVAGLLASLAIPPAPPIAGPIRITRNPFISTWRVLRTGHDSHEGWLAILGISWFFAVGAVISSELLPLVSATLGGNEHVVTLCLVIFSVAIAAGSMLVNRLLGGKASARFVPVSALAMGLFMIDLWLATRGFATAMPRTGIAAFLAMPGSWRILIDLAGVSMAGGMFVVPLYAILLEQSPPAARSRVIAANNIVNALVMVPVVLIATLLIGWGVTVPEVIGITGAATLPVALLSLRVRPRRT
jgi:acyl-[acyl-carrier-protein]-phospholipid O-acyltransferase/long-chain-fatty-acid--[acyl-carrier-protein] ligase